MSELPGALPECGHGAELSTFLFLSCQVGERHHADCKFELDQLHEIFRALGTPVKLETWISNVYQWDPKAKKYTDVLPPAYFLSLGCARTYKRLGQKSGKLLTADELLNFIAETLRGGRT